jgi:hypothetical protein
MHRFGENAVGYIGIRTQLLQGKGFSLVVFLVVLVDLGFFLGQLGGSGGLILFVKVP